MTTKSFQPIHFSVQAEGMELGKDYAIVSMEHINDPILGWELGSKKAFLEGLDVNDTKAYDHICGIDSLQLLESEKVYTDHQQFLKAELVKRGYGHIQIHKTSYISNATFYYPKQPIQLAAAHTFGLGVVQILRGKFKGAYMLYNYQRMNAEDLVEEDDYDEQMILHLYFQFTNPSSYFDKQVVNLLERNWDLAQILIINHKEYMRDYFHAVAAYHRAKEQGSVPIDLMRVIRGMRVF
ncbi:hypothetical protein [Sporosarcina sp. ITBMC105]